MSDSKGKGNAAALKEDEAGNGVSNTINNLLNNVVSSASGLAKSAFTAPSSNELSSASSSSIVGSGKAQPSSSSSGTSAYADSSKQAASASSHGGQTQNTQPQGLRTHQASHASLAEAEFSSFLDSAPALDYTIPTSDSLDQMQTGQQTPGSYAGTGTDYPHPSSIHVQRTPPSGFKTVQEAQAHDGAGVLEILGTFRPEEKDYFEPQTIEAEIEEWRLTPAQISLAKQLASELHVPSTNDPAQMVPKAFQDGEKEEYLPEEYAQDSWDQFGEALSSGEAKQKWISQWEEVLSRYQDEVWGGMLPLVKEAKREVEEAKVEGTDGRETKAVRRLGMVLSHIFHDHQPGPEVVPGPEAEPEQPARRPMRHWTKEQEIAHREAINKDAAGQNTPSNAQEHPLASFQKQLEILEEQNKKRLRVLKSGGNGVFPHPVPDGQWKGSMNSRA